MAVPPGATIQSLTDLLQLKYMPGIQRQFNDSYPNLTYIRQNTEDITAEGDKAIIAIEVGLNEAGGVHGESADVATAVSPSLRQVQVKLKQMTFRARITWRLMKKARTNANAFARGLDLTMRSTRDAFILTANGYTWGDGSGVVARVKAKVDGNLTIDLDRVHGILGQPYGVIRQNQLLHILDTKGFTGGVSNDRGTFRVSKIDYETDATIVRVTVVVVTGAIANVAVNDYAYLQNSISGWADTDETEDNTPPMGLPGFYDDTLVDPLQGLAKATEPTWRPHKRPNATQATIISDMNKARDAYMKRAASAGGRNKELAYLISSYESRQRWHDQLLQKAEWRNVKQLDGSVDVAVYAGRPWFADHTAPDGTVYFVPRGTLQRYNAATFMEVIDDDNSALHQVANKTAFDMMWSALYEYGIGRRNVLVSLPGLTW